MALQKFAQTEPVKAYYNSDTENTYKVELYLEGTAPTARTFQQSGKIKLVRGNSSPSHKYENFVSTYVEVKIIDEDYFIQDIVESFPDNKLVGIVYRNNAIVFKGFISTNRSKRKFLEGINIITLKVYDGFNLLKNFNDFTVFGSNTSPLHSIFLTILNSLQLDLDILIYIATTPQDGLEIPAEAIGFNVSEWMILQDDDVTYYDLLNDLLVNLNLQIFSFESTFCISQVTFREESSHYYTLVEPNGVKSSGSASLVKVRSTYHLAKDPLKYSLQSIDEAAYICPISKDDYTAFLMRRQRLDWSNPHFKSGVDGWSVSGTVKTLKNAVQINPGSSLYQETSEVESGEDITIQISSTIIRYLNNANNNAVATAYSIQAIETGSGASQSFYLHNPVSEAVDPFWNSSSDYREIAVYAEVPAYPGVLSKGYTSKYYSLTVQDEINVQVPTFNNTGKGKIRITLYGGSNPAVGKPKEVSCQHNYAVVKLTETEQESEDVFPSDLRIACKINSIKNALDIDAKFSDNDPYIPLSFYNLGSSYVWIDGESHYNKTELWNPGGKGLHQIFAERIVKSDSGNIQAYDLTFNNLPASQTNFIDLIKADFDGEGETLFIPVYEECYLETHTSRMVIVEHKQKSPTITTSFEYIFDDK